MKQSGHGDRSFAGTQGVSKCGYPDFAAFLINRNQRSIAYSNAMWALAVQLGKCEFIRPPTHPMRIPVSVQSHSVTVKRDTINIAE